MSRNVPDITVIIPTRNRADLIGYAIDSLFAQKFTDWECLIIDDGSTDHTRDVVERKTASDDRFVYVPRRPLGVCSARNHGVRIARGKYLCFLDSDDAYLPEGLLDLYQAIISRPEVKLVYADYKVNDIRTGEERHFSSFPPPPRPYLYQCFIKPRGNPILPSASIVEKDAFNHVGLFDTFFVTSQTVEFWGRFVEKYDIGYLNKATSVYRRHDGQVTTQLQKRLYFYDQIALRAIDRLTVDVLFPGDSIPEKADRIEAFAKTLYRSPFPILQSCLKLGTVAQKLSYSKRREKLISVMKKNAQLIIEQRLGLSLCELHSDVPPFLLQP